MVFWTCPLGPWYGLKWTYDVKTLHLFLIILGQKGALIPNFWFMWVKHGVFQILSVPDNLGQKDAWVGGSLRVCQGSVKGQSRDHQGCIGRPLEVSMGVQLGIHCGSLEIINMSWSPRTFQFTHSPIQKGSCMIVGTVRSKRNPSMHGKWPNAFSSLSSSIFRGGHILHYWGL